MVYGIIPTSIKLEPAIKERVKKLSRIKQRTPHALMKEAICLYLAYEEKIQQSQEEIARRWKNVETNPAYTQLVEHNTMITWLTHWSTEKESENLPWQR